MPDDHHVRVLRLPRRTIARGVDVARDASRPVLDRAPDVGEAAGAVRRDVGRHIPHALHQKPAERGEHHERERERAEPPCVRNGWEPARRGRERTRLEEADDLADRGGGHTEGDEEEREQRRER